MRDFQFSPSFSCVCGQTHSCEIEKVIIGSGALDQAAPLLVGMRRVLIVSDGNTRGLAVGRLIAALSAQGVPADEMFFDQTDVLIPDEKATRRILDLVQADTDALVGVGSGVINDLCKYASFLKKLPYMIIATAPSMDGYASKGAAMIAEGMKVTYTAHVPRFIIGDIDILKDAPLPMIRAGVGDILGKFSCLNDWKLSQLITGEHFCQTIYDMTMDEAKACADNAPRCLARDPEAVGRLMQSLVAVGIAMAYLGNSRPASGAEHHFSHFMEITGIISGTPYFPHGIDVGYSAVIAQDLRRRLALETPARLTRRLGRETFDARVRRVYGPLAGEVEALQDKTGFYRENRLPIITEKWDAIKRTLLDSPSPDALLSLLHSAGYHMSEFIAEYGEQKIADCIESSKDLKDRYTLLWLLNDTGLLEEYAHDEYERIRAWD